MGDEHSFERQLKLMHARGDLAQAENRLSRLLGWLCICVGLLLLTAALPLFL